MRCGRRWQVVVLGVVLAALVLAVGACSGGSGSRGLVATSGGAADSTGVASGGGSSTASGGSEHRKHRKHRGTSPTSPTSVLPSTSTTAAKTTTTQAAATIGPSDFGTPSGNIGCYVDPRAGARCDITSHSWAAPPKPATCQLDYGQGLTVVDGPGEVVCAGDTALGSSNVLAYGSVAQQGPYRCDSEESGITCVDTQTGHGFFLSSQSYRLF